MLVTYLYFSKGLNFSYQIWTPIFPPDNEFSNLTINISSGSFLEIPAGIFSRLSVFDLPKSSSNTFKTQKNISLYFTTRHIMLMEKRPSRGGRFGSPGGTLHKLGQGCSTEDGFRQPKKITGLRFQTHKITAFLVPKTNVILVLQLR